MSKKMDRKLKKYMKRHSTPKRIAGVKIPKSLRRAADTELGAAVIAQILVTSAAGALASPMMARVRRDAEDFAGKVAHGLSDASKDAAGKVDDALHNMARKRSSAESRVM
jgi:hypothetical protein